MCKWQSCIFAKVEVCGCAGGPWSPCGPTPVLSWVLLWPRGGQNQSQTWFNAYHKDSHLLSEALTFVLRVMEENSEIIPYFETYLFTFGILWGFANFSLDIVSWSCSLVAVCGSGMWDPPEPGSEPVSPVRAGGWILYCWATREAQLYSILDGRLP